MATRLAVRVEDVNADVVAGAQVVVTDIIATHKPQLPGITQTGTDGDQVLIFDLGTTTKISIELRGQPSFFGYTVTVTYDPGKQTFQIDARSPIWDFVSVGHAGEAVIRLRLIARRIRPAPQVIPSTPARDIAPPIVDSPGGIALNASRQIIGLFDAKVSGFPAVIGNDILGSPDANGWGRFAATTSDIDTQEAGREIQTSNGSSMATRAVSAC